MSRSRIGWTLPVALAALVLVLASVPAQTGLARSEPNTSKRLRCPR